MKLTDRVKEVAKTHIVKCGNVEYQVLSKESRLLNLIVRYYQRIKSRRIMCVYKDVKLLDNPNRYTEEVIIPDNRRGVVLMNDKGITELTCNEYLILKTK